MTPALRHPAWKQSTHGGWLRALHGLLRPLLVAGLALQVLVAHAEVEAGLAETLMRKSGLWEQLGELGSQMRGTLARELERAPQPPSAAELARMVQVIDTAYAAGSLRASALAVLARGLDRQQVPALQAWFASRVGSTITRLEEQATASDTDPALALRQGEALLAEASPERRQLMQDLVVATRSAEMLTSLNINTVVAMAQGAARARPEGAAPAEAALRAQLEGQRAQMQQGLAAYLLATWARVYDPLPTDELAQYLAFVKGSAGAHFNDLSMVAFDAAMVDAAARFGAGLAAQAAN